MLGLQVLVTLGKQIGPQFLRYPVLLTVPFGAAGCWRRHAGVLTLIPLWSVLLPGGLGSLVIALRSFCSRFCPGLLE